MKKGYTHFAEGDVLFAKITPCMQNGKHAIARELIDGIGFGTTEFHVIRPGTDLVAEWAHFYIRQPQILRDAMAHFTGAVGQQRVPKDFLAGLEIPLPPLAVQKRMAGILKEQLAAVERARAAADAQLEAAKALPAAYLRDVFLLRGANGEFVAPLTAAPLTPMAPNGWRWQLLRELGRLESGHTPSRYRPEWWGGDVPWLALPDIRELDGKVAEETAEYTNEDGIANSSARILPKGTVCLSRTASVGFVTIMGRPMATSQDFVNWVCGPNLDPYFLMHLLMASRDYIRSVSSGAVHKTVYVPTVKEFKVCVPEIAKQRELAGWLNSKIDEAERTIQLIESQLDTINKLPAALLRTAFQGRL